ILCGHYGCSGVQAAMTKHRIGLSDNWLRHVQDVAEKHDAELRTLIDQDLRHRRLCEMNARMQVQNIVQCTAVQEAWERGQPLEVHGWIYDLKDGLIHDLHVSKSGT
ncbi:MAG TPA: carbonic anhydrase, partial [Burkholderiales bacterium]|nr:carbonic anhydrase [Burkholderiales bacterium]